MVMLNDDQTPQPRQDKKQLTPEQKAKAAASALKYGVLISDVTSHLGAAFGITAIAWASLIGMAQVHIPFLPVWLATFGVLMALRHVGKTWGKAKSAGQLEAQMEAYKAVMLQQAATMPKGGGLEDLLKNIQQMTPEQHDDAHNGPYL